MQRMRSHGIFLLNFSRNLDECSLKNCSAFDISQRPGSNRAASNARVYERNRQQAESVPRSEMKPRYHDRLVEYNAEETQEIWEDIIELDLDVADPFTARTNDEYRGMVSAAIRAIKRARKASNKSSYSFKREPFRRAPYAEQKVLAEIFRFESRMARCLLG